MTNAWRSIAWARLRTGFLDKYLSPVASIIVCFGAGTLKGNRLLPFLAALILLTFALGSLPRTQPGGSLLLNSYWLIYLLSLAPIIALGLMIALIIYLAYNSRSLSDAFAFGFAKRRGQAKKKRKNLQLVVSLVAWGVAIEILLLKCGGIFSCSTSGAAPNASSAVVDSISGSSATNTLPLLGAAYQISSFVQSNWFYAAFLGLLAVTSVIVARGLIISWKETKADLTARIPPARIEIVTSVEDAFRILTAQPEADPRARIINCYQRMVQAAQRLGASVTSDQTARELEAAIRAMLGIKGSSMAELTDLFEEARYSLHPITETDAEQAQQCLLSIAEEMHITLSV
jgi:hypothetical protein